MEDSFQSVVNARIATSVLNIPIEDILQIWYPGVVLRILHVILCNVNNCGLQVSWIDSNFARSFLHGVEMR